MTLRCTAGGVWDLLEAGGCQDLPPRARASRANPSVFVKSIPTLAGLSVSPQTSSPPRNSLSVWARRGFGFGRKSRLADRVGILPAPAVRLPVFNELGRESRFRSVLLAVAGPLSPHDVARIQSINRAGLDSGCETCASRLRVIVTTRSSGLRGASGEALRDRGEP